MSSMMYQGHTALEYAKMACDTMMKKFAPEDLPPKGRFHYHQGVFLSGMQKTWRLCQEDKYFSYLKAWVDSIIDEKGEIHEFDEGQLDDIQPGILLYDLYHETKDERYAKALHTLLPLVKNFPKNPEGGLWHKAQHKNEMWLDGLYMGGPIAAQYGAEFNDTSYFDLCIYQALMMERNTRDKKTGLLYHAFDFNHQMFWADPVTGCSPEFWGRSIGWVPVALLDEAEFIPQDYPRREAMLDVAIDLLKAVVRFQDAETGLWYQVVDKGGQEGNWLESSCTCLFTAAICKAVRCGYLEESYLDYAKKGYQGIIDRLRYNEQGVVIDNICVGTGVGDYWHYCNRPTSENDLHGAGAFILMCQEVAQVL